MNEPSFGRCKRHGYAEESERDEIDLRVCLPGAPDDVVGGEPIVRGPMFERNTVALPRTLVNEVPRRAVVRRTVERAGLSPQRLPGRVHASLPELELALSPFLGSGAKVRIAGKAAGVLKVRPNRRFAAGFVRRPMARSRSAR